MKYLLALVFALTACPVSAQGADPSLYDAMRWRAIGPFRGGRTVGAAGVPQQPNVFYIGVNNGGVWKTTDYGLTWTPLLDGQPTQSIGATAFRLRRNNWTDTPLPLEFSAGTNPPDGAIIDYYLAADTGPVTLDIVTAAGKLVRRYSSDDKPEPLDEKDINVPPYWARPPRMLSAAKGMHRFVWDLRYPTPGAVQRDFPISAIPGDTPREPLGVLALPGAYLVKLTVGGKTSTHPLTLKMDPRATITPLGLTRQFTLATKLAGMMNKTFAAMSSRSSSPHLPAPGPEAPAQSPDADLIALANDLATAYDVVEGADRAPTAQAAQAVTHLEQRLTALLKERP